jgi:hypothetical protein
VAGKPEENGYAERLARINRQEDIDLSWHRDFTNPFGQLDRFLDDVYDRNRIRSPLGYRTLAEFQQRWLRGGKRTWPRDNPRLSE